MCLLGYLIAIFTLNLINLLNIPIVYLIPFRQANIKGPKGEKYLVPN